LRLRGENILIPARYQGPDGSANGGYACGLVAARLDTAVAEVTLRLPPPLETALRVERDAAGVRVLAGDVLVADAVPSEVELEPPPVSSAEAEAAAERTTVFAEHEFPRCFVCGPLRDEGDGLRIFPGPVRDGVVAAPWRARDVSPELVWAAIDCIGAFAVGYPDRGSVLLGHVESPIGCNRAIDEQVYRFVLRQRGGRDRTVARGNGERGNLKERLSLDAELLSRRCEHLDLRRFAQQSDRELGTGHDKMLAVVEDHE